MNIKVNIIFVETHHSIEIMKRYHEFFRRVYTIIVAKLFEIDSNSILQMIFVLRRFMIEKYSNKNINDKKLISIKYNLIY